MHAGLTYMTGIKLSSHGNFAEEHVHLIAKCIVPNLLGDREAQLQTAAFDT
jgi:hypothetical protein